VGVKAGIYVIGSMSHVMASFGITSVERSITSTRE
jgi:hypothetical protein